ncbi:MAG: TonB-dependent siderophore receptor [Pyrinomonadaceae bacterium]
MGAIVAFTIGSSRAMNVAYASDRNGHLVIERTADGEFSPIEFNIPAGPLMEVIEAFQKKTGITFEVENRSILFISSPGVVGKRTMTQALREILKDTGVNYVFTGSRSVLLNLQAESASVEIKGAGSSIIYSPKYARTPRDIPQTIDVISQGVIEQQGATTLRDVLNNVPGITLTAGEGGAPAGDNLTIRGFSARNDINIDGVRDLGAQSRDPFNLEQVEVVKGPNSTFTGRGSTGGTINLVSKLPDLRRSFSAMLVAGTDDAKRSSVDFNLPVSNGISLRLNAMVHDSDFPGRAAIQNRRWGMAPTITFGLGTPTRYTLGYFYIGQDNTSDYGIPWVTPTNNPLLAFRNRPAPVPRSTFYGFVDRDKEKLRADQITGRVEHEFNDQFTIRNQFRYGYSRRDSIATPPRFTSDVNSTSINREMRAWLATDDIWDNQTDITANFKTGSIEHSAVFGGSLSYEKNARVLRSAPNSLTTLIDPNPNDVYPGEITIDPRRPEARANSLAAYFLDTIKLSKQWEFVGGIRWDRFDVSGENAATVDNQRVLVPLDRVDSILSGRAALIFRPRENGSIYASFGTSSNPSLEGLLYLPADVRTDPEETRTYEFGTKWDLFDNTLLVSSALFQVEKTNARTPSLVTGGPVTLDGDHRVRGIEFSATGNITRNWQLLAGYTLLDSEIVRSNTVAEIGRVLVNTPRNSFNLWSTYRWNKVFLGGGPRFVGRRYGNNSNTRTVDSYWTVDAVLSYQLTRNVDLRMNINNLADKYFIDRIGGGHIIPGAGRSMLVSTGFSF